MIKRTIIVTSVILTLLLAAGVCIAAPYHTLMGEVHGHRSPDGSISFFAEDSKSGSIFNPSSWNISFHRVFPLTGSPWHYVYVEVSDKKMRKTPIQKVELTIDGKGVPLEPMDKYKPTTKDKFFQAYYIVSEDSIKSLQSAKEIIFTADYSGEAEDLVVKIDKKVMQRLSLLPSMKKEYYVRDGKVYGTEPDLDLANEILYPSMYIPNATPEDVKGALMYYGMVDWQKGDDKYLYYKGHEVRYFPTEPTVFEMESLASAGGRTYSLLTVRTVPYKAGTFVTVGLIQKYYNQGGSLLFQYDYGGSGLVNMRSYWRSQAEFWARNLLKLYYEKNGSYFYGVELDLQTKKGPFKVIRTGSPAPPEIQAGDLLVDINGAPTEYMRPLDLAFWLTANPGPATLTFKAPTGESKEVTVTPKANAPLGGKDYKTIVQGVPKKFISTQHPKIPPPTFFYGPAFDPVDKE